MQSLHVYRVLGSAFLCFRYQIENPINRIDDRRAGNPDHLIDVLKLADVRDGHGGPKVQLPQWRRCGRVIGVERIDVVLHRRDVDNVVDPLTDGQARNIQRLGVHLPVDGTGKQLAELIDVYVGRGETRLVQVRSRSTVVIVLSQHTRGTRLSVQGARSKQRRRAHDHRSDCSDQRP